VNGCNALTSYLHISAQIFSINTAVREVEFIWCKSPQQKDFDFNCLAVCIYISANLRWGSEFRLCPNTMCNPPKMWGRCVPAGVTHHVLLHVAHSCFDPSQGSAQCCPHSCGETTWKGKGDYIKNQLLFFLYLTYSLDFFHVISLLFLPCLWTAPVGSLFWLMVSACLISPWLIPIEYFRIMT